MLDISPRESYRLLITKVRTRTEKYFELISLLAKEGHRNLVDEIIGLIGKVNFDKQYVFIQ